MKVKFSRHWKSSKQKRKQRKYRYTAPLHVRKRFLSVNLSKELRKRYKRRNVPARKNDVVRVLRGNFKKRNGKVNKVDYRKLRVYVDGIENIKKDGTKAFYPLNPSNLQIIELNLDDRERVRAIERNIVVKK